MNIIFPPLIEYRSIIVLATPRSGSTALGINLARKYNLCNYGEAFSVLPPGDPKEEQKIRMRNKFWENFNDDKEFLVKIFPPHKIDQADFERIIKNNFVINLKRRNVVNQIASYYTSRIRKIPRYPKYTETAVDDIINIDKDILKDTIKYLLYQLNIAVEREKYGNMILYYEDIISELTNTVLTPTPKPSNYPDLIKTIEEMLPEITR